MNQTNGHKNIITLWDTLHLSALRCFEFGYLFVKQKIQVVLILKGHLTDTWHET